MRGIYIHIPFCLRKCPYCDFYSVGYDEGTADRYIDALIRNFRQERYSGKEADTVYLGGGTPTALSERQLERLMSGVFESFDIKDNAEITIEANPCTADEEKLKTLRKAGINRISFGVQSADDGELKALGRLHDYETARRAVTDCFDAGIENISCDIMTGLAGQEAEGLLSTAKKLTGLPVRHISAYMLKIEKGTPFDCEEVRRTVPDDDKTSTLYLALTDYLSDRGFAQYEISNYSYPGFESRHNLKYWTGEEYAGFGASAHSLFEGERYFVPASVKDYIGSEFQSELSEDEPYSEQEEYIMLASRLKSGLETGRLTSLYGEEKTLRLTALAKKLEKNGLCKVSDERISLTPRGFLVSNAVILEFLSCVGLA